MQIAGASGTYGSVALSIDWSSGSPNSAGRWGVAGQNATGYAMSHATIDIVPELGRHTLDMLEYCWGGTMTFYGHAGAPGDIRPGLTGVVWV